MKKLQVLLVLIPFLFCGCVPKSQYNSLLAENEQLKNEIDELKNGESRLISIIDKAYENGDYKTAKENIALLAEKHPESDKNSDYEKLLKTIENKEKEIELQKQKEAEEKERLANLNNTGNWRIWNYVDSFGEKTDDKYITNYDHFKGNFSNNATTKSELTAKILIDGKNDISMKLFEFGGKTEVKGDYSYPITAYVTLRDSSGKDYDLKCKNTSDRFSFGKDASLIIHNALMKGGIVKIEFRTYQYDTRDSTYLVTIDEQYTKYYDNAYRIFSTGK